MKITKPVSIEIDVEIEFGRLDIQEVLADLDSDANGEWLLKELNYVAQYLKAIPGDAIARLTTTQRALIETFLKEQSERYDTSTTASQDQQIQTATDIRNESSPGSISGHLTITSDAVDVLLKQGI